jgi:hypothetical protein
MPLVSSFSLVALTLTSAQAPAPPPVSVEVRVDSAHREVVITAGPYRLPANPPGMHEGMESEPEDLLVQQFAWPLTTWVRGFRLAIVDGAGRPLPRGLMHHMSMMNFDRREVVYPIVERLLGAGRETADVVFPSTVGIPVNAGHRLGLYIMWDNQTGTEVPDAYLRLSLPWISPRQVPKPVTALPFLVDVNFVYGGANSYAIPPGRSTRTYEFSVPLAGHLLAAGGHLHDFGASLRLEDTRSGKTLVRIRPKRAPDGRVLGMSRQLFGVRGQGPKLRPDRTYRLVVEYDNPTGAPAPHVMGSIAGLFVPDDLRQLPSLNPDDPAYRADAAWLARIKSGAGDMGGMDHHHQHD